MPSSKIPEETENSETEMSSSVDPEVASTSTPPSSQISAGKNENSETEISSSVDPDTAHASMSCHGACASGCDNCGRSTPKEEPLSQAADMSMRMSQRFHDLMESEQEWQVFVKLQPNGFLTFYIYLCYKYANTYVCTKGYIYRHMKDN